VASWIARLGADRTVTAMMGASRDDDVDDPFGKKQKDYRRTAKELDSLVTRLVELMWPPGFGGASAQAPA
jgi:protein-tyrosine-phosphatase